MIRFEVAFGLMVMALWVFCLVEAISSPEDRIRNLPKIAWILIVLFFPFAGSVAWLVAGRPQPGAGRPAHERAVPDFPEYDRRGRSPVTRPGDDQEFLRNVRERAEAQRRSYREAQLEQQKQEREQRKGQGEAETGG